MNDVFVSIVRILFFLFMLGVVWNIIKMLVSAIADKIKPFVGIVVIIGGLIFGNYLIGECISEALLWITIPVSIYFLYWLLPVKNN